MDLQKYSVTVFDASTLTQDSKGAVQKEMGSPLRFKKEVIQYGA
jgi:hypothetical protein